MSPEVFEAFHRRRAHRRLVRNRGGRAARCQDEIVKYCSDKNHGNREVHICQEQNQDKVSHACHTALETTGGGRDCERKKAENF